MPATSEHFIDMFDYMIWGDNLAMAAARTVSDEGYFREQNISMGSIHKLLAHALGAQTIWFTRWRGTSPTKILNHEDFPTRESIEQRWPLLHAELLEFVRAQTPASLAKVVQYRSTKGDPFELPLGELMTHVTDHATYHRGQLNSMIKLAGGKPAAFGYQLYALQKARPSS